MKAFITIISLLSICYAQNHYFQIFYRESAGPIDKYGETVREDTAYYLVNIVGNDTIVQDVTADDCKGKYVGLMYGYLYSDGWSAEYICCGYMDLGVYIIYRHFYRKNE